MLKFIDASTTRTKKTVYLMANMPPAALPPTLRGEASAGAEFAELVEYMSRIFGRWFQLTSRFFTSQLHMFYDLRFLGFSTKVYIFSSVFDSWFGLHSVKTNNHERDLWFVRKF